MNIYRYFLAAVLIATLPINGCKKRNMSSNTKELINPLRFMNFDGLTEAEKKEVCSERLLVVYTGNAEGFGSVEYVGNSLSKFDFFKNGYPAEYDRLEKFIQWEYYQLIRAKKAELEAAFASSDFAERQEKCKKFNQNLLGKQESVPQVVLMAVTDGPNISSVPGVTAEFFNPRLQVGDSEISRSVFGFKKIQGEWHWQVLEKATPWCLQGKRIAATNVGRACAGSEFYISDALQATIDSIDTLKPVGLTEFDRAIYMIKSHGGKVEMRTAFPPTIANAIAEDEGVLGLIPKSAVTLIDSHGGNGDKNLAQFVGTVWSPQSVCENLFLRMPDGAVDTAILPYKKNVEDCIRRAEAPAWALLKSGKKTTDVSSVQGADPTKDQGADPTKDQGADPTKDQGADPTKDQGDPTGDQGVGSLTLNLSASYSRDQGKGIPIFANVNGKYPTAASENKWSLPLLQMNMASSSPQSGFPEAYRFFGRAIASSEGIGLPTLRFHHFRNASLVVYDTCYADQQTSRWKRISELLVQGKQIPSEDSSPELRKILLEPEKDYRVVKLANHEPLLKSSISYAIPPLQWSFLTWTIGKLTQDLAHTQNKTNVASRSLTNFLRPEFMRPDDLTLVNHLMNGFTISGKNGDARKNRIFPSVTACAPGEPCKDYAPFTEFAVIEKMYGILQQLDKRLVDLQPLATLSSNRETMQDLLSMQHNRDILKGSLTLFQSAQNLMFEGVFEILLNPRFCDIMERSGREPNTFESLAVNLLTTSAVTFQNFYDSTEKMRAYPRAFSPLLLYGRAHVKKTLLQLERDGLDASPFMLTVTNEVFKLYLTQKMIESIYVASMAEKIDSSEKTQGRKWAQGMRIGLALKWYQRSSLRGGAIFGGASKTTFVHRLIEGLNGLDNPQTLQSLRGIGMDIDSIYTLYNQHQADFKKIAKHEKALWEFIDRPGITAFINRPDVASLSDNDDNELRAILSSFKDMMEIFGNVAL